MKRAFTLLEMLIVVGIIAILAAVILSSFGSARESAKLSKCQSNLRNLAAAANAYAMAHEENSYPDAAFASDFEFSTAGAWIAWTREGAGQCISCLSDERDVRYALTNGVMWRAVNGNSDVYKCPVHVQTCLEAVKRVPGWSYVMNAMFAEIKLTDSSQMFDRLLMFAELPGLDNKKINPEKFGARELPTFSTANSTVNDAALMFRGAAKSGLKGAADVGGSAESIGFNHVRGNNLVGVVAFADGHTETLVLPRSGDLEDLTEWLCKSYDVSYKNGRYEYDRDSASKGN